MKDTIIRKVETHLKKQQIKKIMMGYDKKVLVKLLLVFLGEEGINEIYDKSFENKELKK
jgi:hypothetical protein